MFDIALTVRDNPEWLNTYLLSYKKYTSNPYSYKITIVDTSIESNKKNTRLILSNFKDLNIELIDGNREQHYHKTWIDAIKNTDCEFVLLTHVDVVFLMNDWDQFIIDCLKHQKTLISVGHGKILDDWSKYQNQKIEFCPESSWVCTYTDILIESEFDHGIINNIRMEHGRIKLLHDQRKEEQLYITNKIQGRPKYGDIFLFNDKELVYHNYYSGRIKEDNLCPVPQGIESDYISNRENFDITINRIEKFLNYDDDRTLTECLNVEL